METALSPDAKCNACGYPIDTATGVTGRIPDPGDVSVCIACGTPEIFAMCPTGMVTRVCSDEEMQDVMQNEDIKRLIVAVYLASSKDPNWPKGPKSE